MIDPKELRIGNFLEYEYQSVTVDIISKTGFAVSGDELYPVEENIEDVKPIPITPEWLERMGGIRNGTNFYIEPSTPYNFVFVGEFVFYNGIKFLCLYVHTFQNLYFALTGKELEIKP